jgi:hypothetical protein
MEYDDDCYVYNIETGNLLLKRENKHYDRHKNFYYQMKTTNNDSILIVASAFIDSNRKSYDTLFIWNIFEDRILAKMSDLSDTVRFKSILATGNNGEVLVGFLKNRRPYVVMYRMNFQTSGKTEDEGNNPVPNLYPNPATDYIEIAIDNHTLQDMVGNISGTGSAGDIDRTLKDAVKVYDVLGVCVATHPLTPSREGVTIRLDVSGLAAGVYFVRVGDRMYKFVKI